MNYFSKSVILNLLLSNVVVHSESQAKYVPNNLCIRLTTNTTAVVQWFEPTHLRDEITGFTIYHTLDPQLPLKDWNFTVTGNYPLATIRNIELGEWYTFRIRMESLNFDGLGPISEEYIVQMVNRTRSCYDQPKTSIVRSLNLLRAAATSYMSVEVWWNVPHEPHLHTGYCIFYGINNSHYWQNVTVGLVENVELTDLQQAAVYTISLSIITVSGLSHFVQEVTVKVQPEEVPLNIMAYDVTSYSFGLKWSPPPRFLPVQYKISFTGFKEYVDGLGHMQHVEFPTSEIVVGGYITYYNIDMLQPNTNYSINIRAVPADHSYRPATKINVTTRMAAPPELIKPILSGTPKGSNLQVQLPKASDEFGPISYYYIVVVPQDDETDKVPTNIYVIEDMQETSVNNEITGSGAYVAAKFFQKIPYAFILGNGEKYGGYTNRKLSSDTKYRMFVRAVVDAPFEELFTDSPYSDVFYLNMAELKTKLVRDTNKLL